MNATYSYTTPSTPVVTEAEVCAALMMPEGLHTSRINAIIAGVTVWVEKVIGRSFINRTVTLKLDKWPCKEVIHLPYPPYVSVVSFSYIDSNGDSQDLVANTDYEAKLTGDEGRVVVAPGASWPSVKSDKYEPITLTYTAGFGSAASDVPQHYKELIIRESVMAFNDGQLDDSYGEKRLRHFKNYFDYHAND